MITVALVAISAGCSSPAVKKNPLPLSGPLYSPPVLQTGTTEIATSAAERAQYVGDLACAECHRAIWRSHTASGHALTLQPVSMNRLGARFHNGNRVTDTTNDTAYRAGIVAGRCVIVSDGPVGKQVIPAEWALGSGEHGQTYLGRDRGIQWTTLRLSYYEKIKDWDFTPGDRPDPARTEEENGHPLSVVQVQGCLSCHATTLKVTANGPDPSASRYGVGCERCHGPGRKHIMMMKGLLTSTRRGDVGMEDLRHAPPARISALCGSCHRSEIQPRPEDSDPDNTLSRFKSTALEMSACFQKSGTLTCISCHDPHTRTASGGSAYEAVCLSCHNPAKSAALSSSAGNASSLTCKVNPRGGCIACHMPAQTTTTFPHTIMHNHRIKVWTRSGA